MTKKNEVPEVEETAVVIADTTAMQVAATPADILNQVKLIQKVMESVMVEGVHYGVIPGTKKPTLLKPGAEKLILTFRFDPEYTWKKEILENGHREYEFECTIYHIDSGKRLGAGTGICSTMESKYRYRNKKRKCPYCGNETIIKGRAEYGGGWICWKKEGKSDGCGAKFKEGDPVIESQEVGRIENSDIADTWNTVKKIAKKRSLTDAVLTVTAASDIFTQDTEDLPRDMLGKDVIKPSANKDELPPRKSKFAFLEEVQKLKKRLLKTKGGETGEAIYREVLKTHNAKKSNEILKREAKEAFFKELRVRVIEAEKADPENDMPTFAVNPKVIEAEYKRLKKNHKNKTMPNIIPADVDNFYDNCDPGKLIKSSKEFDNYLTLGQFENAVDWIYKQWEATQ